MFYCFVYTFTLYIINSLVYSMKYFLEKSNSIFGRRIYTVGPLLSEPQYYYKNHEAHTCRAAPIYQQNFWKIKSSQSLFYLFNLQFLLPLVDIVIGTGHDVVYLIFCGTEISWASFLLVCLKGTVGGTSSCIVTKLTTSPTLYVLWFAIVICLLCRVISLL